MLNHALTTSLRFFPLLAARTGTKALLTAVTCASLLQGTTSDALAEEAPTQAAREKHAREPFRGSFALGPTATASKGFQWASQRRASTSFSFGLRGSWVNTGSDSAQSTYGIAGQYHLLGGDVMDDGPVLDTSLALALAHQSTPAEGFGTKKGVRLTTSLHWQWVHESGFGILAGAGIGAQHIFGSDLEYLGTSGALAVSSGDSGALHGFLDTKVAWTFR